MAVSFPSVGKRERGLQVFTVEECEACHLKVKRAFQQGDYVYKPAGACQKCGEKTWVVAVYGEPLRPRPTPSTP